jgi:hypothetical protein
VRTGQDQGAVLGIELVYKTLKLLFRLMAAQAKELSWVSPTLS